MTELAQAYNHVFRGTPTKIEQEMVLADLAVEAGFYQVVIPGNGIQLGFENGKRFVYARIHKFLTMSQEEWRELEMAAKAEAITNANEGHLI